MVEVSYRKFIMKYITYFCYVSALDIFLMYECLYPDTYKDYAHLKVVLSQMKREGIITTKIDPSSGANYPMGDMPILRTHRGSQLYKLRELHEPYAEMREPKWKRNTAINYSTGERYNVSNRSSTFA